MNENIEIERKYIIKMPDVARLETLDAYSHSDILQTYLVSDDGTTERVRRRAYDGAVRYYHTVKRRIDAMSCIEEEREICEREYGELLRRADTSAVPIEKTRYTFAYQGLTVEIDRYARWDNIAVLEVELPSRDFKLELPDFISVLFEATGDFRFSNASLSKLFPSEADVVSYHL